MQVLWWKTGERRPDRCSGMETPVGLEDTCMHPTVKQGVAMLTQVSRVQTTRYSTLEYRNSRWSVRSVCEGVLELTTMWSWQWGMRWFQPSKGKAEYYHRQERIQRRMAKWEGAYIEDRKEAGFKEMNKGVSWPATVRASTRTKKREDVRSWMGKILFTGQDL